MKDQLIRLMESESMSPAKFADEIGVQRSSISHILSDRNKPSYDFILKIMNRFPDLNTEWLLTGSGAMKKSVPVPAKEIKQTSIFDTNLQNTSNNIQTSTRSIDFAATKKEVAASIEPELNKQTLHVKNTEEIHDNSEFTNVNSTKFVIVFYKDGTFERYASR